MWIGAGVECGEPGCKYSVDIIYDFHRAYDRFEAWELWNQKRFFKVFRKTN